ncbi:nicotinate-nucleotide--dimethylbenzimidazole phosphoribosyltransferase [Streptomyces sp. CL12-4]|uniref:nicotinate-nucleotide--dimethylbenzimidazole phosphoribosyltransferase n=1 Tax=Streptomyces sp. CL12-4 TaxID=2810306 RepID=UPI001EFB437B|nr:nicotinate-nucleotide--dimethylbenzimidazole phosphoribosyltransferase [Streptomyces sp. CL12-4]MCG8969862.1 nicotinate-nucleotide--dimethylbenzimidazole phosphoribosyltransferase [Streptomyces sp. CL12-4]
MTDTGQIPGEGLPENSGMVEQPGVPAPGAYTYLSETTAEDEDLLLLPGAQSAWGNEVAPPAPEPVVETVHQPGPHEMSGRDSGSVDLGGVRLPEPAAEPTAAPSPPRRPLHLGPPIPDTSASPVRSLADRGPADMPARHAGPPTAGPEYLDVPQAAAMPPQGAAPWGAQAATSSAGAAPAETVVPVPGQRPEPVGAAQALVTRVATEAVAATGGVPVPGETGEAGAEADAQSVPGDGTTPATGGALETGGVPEADGAQAADGAVGAGDVPGAVAAEQPPAQEPGAVPGPADAPTPEALAPDSVPAPEPVAPESAPLAEAPEAGTEAVPGPEADQAAAVLHAPEAGAEQPGASEPAPILAPGEGAAASEVPVSEPEAEAPAPDSASVSDAVAQSAPAPEPAPAVETPAHESAPVSEALAPESEPAPEPVAPESVPVAEAPEAGTEAVPGPEADQAAAVLHAPETGVEEPGASDPAPILAPGEGAAAPEMPASEPTPAADAPAPVAEVSEPPVAGEAEPVAEPTEDPASQSSPAVDQPQSVEPTPIAESVPTAAPPVAAEPVVAAEADPTAEPIVQAEPTAATEPAPAPAPQQPQPADAPAPQDVQAPAVPEPTPEAPADPTAAPAVVVAEEAAAVQDHPAQPHPELPHPAQGPQSLPDTDATPRTHTATTQPADPAEPPVSHPDQPVGRFVPVGDGQVPTTPHLAPTPPEALVLPPEAHDAPAQDAVADVPAPREADAELVQNADDLDTRDAGQEDQEDPHVSTAAEADVRQSTGPAAPAYDDAEREAVLKVMRERRDIRNGFRSDPIPHEVLLRVLEAAHTAPSVGHSQPWDFVVIRSADTRRAMHELAMRQRDAYAKSLPKGRAKQFKELKIEAILDTPVNIVVTADPTRGGRHTLGRHTQPQMAPYSSALAVENLWLAARAEGLGVGWVSFFDEREMVRALGLPEHLEVVAYLCVGYVDEFPDEPELMQAGWSKRRPLSWVVHEETYGRRALPGEAPHDLLAETVAQIRPLDAKALGEAWERQKRMTKPAGALGMLEIISAQLSGLSRQCPPPIPEPAAVAVFAGDHGVHAQGVTPWPQEVTAQMVANFLGGGAVCNAFATQVGAEVCVVDVGVAADLPATPGLLPRKVRAGTSDMTTGPAMTREEAAQAIEVGIETARDLVAAGNKALLTGEMGIANTTASAALISVFTGADPAEVTGRGTGINDETLARKTEVVRRALDLHQPDPADPIGVLAAIGGFEHAAMVGLLLGGASLRTPVILDGVSAGAAALVARAIAPEVLAACIAGHRSAEPGHVAALNKLGLRPLVDLDLRLGEGTGALLALPMVQSTARAMHEVATFDSAGVTEK